MRNLSLTLAGALALGSCVAAIALTPSTARACGGTFCDGGPQQMPVDQTGENVLFILDDNQVEAHIQIQYDPNTDAQTFAWVIPVMALPEFEPGSQPLFDSLLAGSVPTYGYNTQQDQCNQPLFPNGGFDTGAGASGTGGEDGGGEGDGGGDPDVVYQATVGAFEIAVLDGGTVEGVMQWLGDNGFEQNPEAEPILGEYLDSGFMFVALKLSNGADVGEIHPIVLRYQGTEPCVPLKLTRIAAQDDMDVRVFFLGDSRTVPVNYRHVLVNPLMIDWINLADNYKEVITLAVDADSADGNAFVTEYAGTSAIVSQGNIHSPLWDAQPIAQLVDSPLGLTDLLASQGVMDCSYGQCFWSHPLVEGLLSEYVPVPDGLDQASFYDCLECYEAQIDLAAWDAQAFADAYQARVIDPGAHALDLLAKHDYLTRMYTTISPNEMTLDPIFRQNPNLEDVPNVRIGNLRRHCGGSATFELPDGREVHLEDPSVWPEISGEMPWEEEVATASASGPMMTLVDNTEQIDALLAEYNAQFEYEETGCGCTVSGTGAGTALAFGFMSLLGLSLRRRRG